MFQDFPGGPVVKSPPANAETQVQSLVQEDPTCFGATKPLYHNYWSLRALEPVLPSKRSQHNETLKRWN